MTLSFEEAQQKWAREEFKAWRKDVRPDDTFTITNTVIQHGGCETCAFETAGFEVRNNRTHASLEVEKDFGDLVREITAFAEDE